MSKIRSRDTSLEVRVFRFLMREKIYFQKHYKKCPGQPDIALPAKRKAVFIDGDFWHGWRFSKNINRLPKNYWRDKIKANIDRDKRHRALLKKRGWEVLRIWEHELEKNEDRAFEKIKRFLIS